MSDARERALGRVDPPPTAALHEGDELREILITVSPGQFLTLARDLALLREHGADSNTRAIIDAVRERAAQLRMNAVAKRQAA